MKEATPWAPIHEGEKSVQIRAGVREEVKPWASQMIRPYMPEQHRQFFQQLPFMVASARDSEGRPWATLLCGPPGFVTSPEPSELQVHAKPSRGDALELSFTEGSEVGLLGIELETRRRNRLNGIISTQTDDSFSVAVSQSFGNCPQYISKRVWHSALTAPESQKATNHTRLTASMQNWIRTADTLFLASGYRKKGERRDSDGMDISHRGGSAGFVKIETPQELIIPDYAGNNLFNTLGNIMMDPRVGLLFIDFKGGSLLQLTGKATIDWDSPHIADHAGARRLLRISIEHIIQLEKSVPLRWDEPEGAIRELRLKNKIRESEDVISFEFVPRDGGDLPAFKAGQYLPIELPIDEHQSLERTYSLSNGPGGDTYRISVKREEKGLVSRLLHDRLYPGDVVYAQDPEGEFVLTENVQPVTLISVGIGITPMVSMLHELVQQKRQVYFIHGARDGAHTPLLAEVQQLIDSHTNSHLEIVFSKPRTAQDKQGEGYHRFGRIDGSVVEDFVPGLAGEFFVCGPKEFLVSIVAQLAQLGVNEKYIHQESFK
ncbi:FAD-binding oxidoreductase [Desulforhopalus sp. 52FAK]